MVFRGDKSLFRPSVFMINGAQHCSKKSANIRSIIRLPLNAGYSRVGRRDRFADQRILIEPGAGSTAAKVRLIVDALRPAAFVRMDISLDYLKSATRELAREYP